MPKNQELPFFAYGLFMPGEIAYFQLKEFVDRGAVVEASVIGALHARDGVLLLELTDRGSAISGWRIGFESRRGPDAYERIAAMEPSSQYRWAEADGMNVLVARSPGKGSRALGGPEATAEHLWRGSWADGAFNTALRVVDEALNGADGGELGFYRLQAAHLLLWSSIERYVSLRYGLGSNSGVWQRVVRLAGEEAFGRALRANELLENWRIVRTDHPTGKLLGFDPGRPEEALEYLYRIRSNVTHRGKEMTPDEGLLRAATRELIRVFRACLEAAETESRLDA